ncbi:hypothetical protein [Haloarchaeobius litoreus]|uniref:Lipoprotein n=1 Tax=Haloarchaeobius litoreus TaxID=755306 RepID=A0ABD6DPA1_9EURY|nr:hypothetical protein [Haloarchaeobius litoreus]
MRRRALLATTGALASLAGCSVLSSGSATLDLSVFNHDDSPYTVYIELLRPGENRSRSEALVYDARFDVPADGGETREAVVEKRPYIARYDAYEDDNFLTDQDHFHYYPHDDGDDFIAFDIDDQGTLTHR